MFFGNIGEIDLENPSSYQKIFLTFDIDWASDEVLEYCIDIIEKANVKATWFVTHETPLLERLRANPNFELGIHPNFNPLLEGDFTYGKNYKEVLKHFLNIVPEAKSMRSHCLGISSRILQEAKNLGITHESNICIPAMAAGGGILKPYINWDRLIRCPYHWADDVACMYEQKIDFTRFSFFENHYFIISFHPINLFLNTESLNRYESARSYFQNYEQLKKYQGDSPIGSRSVLNIFLNQFR